MLFNCIPSIGKKILLLTTLVAGVSANAQNTASERYLNELAQQMLTEPENPLGVDQNFLLSLAQIVEDNRLKGILQSYGSRLGKDEDLSYRQIYYDIATALELNPELSGSSYRATAQKLDLLFNNYGAVSSKLESLSNERYRLGMFINDPGLISSLTDITGSYEAAMGVGLGIEILATVSAAIEEQEKFKEDYKKLALISKETVYAEKDINLPNALIDACLLIRGNSNERYGNMITPLYRYDFDNGAQLKVENGILKHISPNGISKNLIKIEKKHDGNYHKQPYSGPVPVSNILSIILVSDDEKCFYISHTPDFLLKSNADKTFKDLTRGGYIFHSENAEILYHSNQIIRPTRGGEAYEFANSNLVYYDFGTDFYRMWQGRYTGEKLKERFTYYFGNSKLKTSYFQNNIDRSTEYVVHGNDVIAFLGWVQNPTDKQMQSFLIVANKNQHGFTNNDFMQNELTGLTEDKIGNLYFASSDGKLGKIDTGGYTLDDNSFTGKIRASLRTHATVRPFDFIKDSIRYHSIHGEFYQWAPKKYFVPRLKLTPDDKHLVYVVRDSLYVINPENLNEIRRFGLSVQPYNIFFSKENGDWVLNVLAINDFKFAVHKKYSMEKLWKTDTSPKPRPYTAKNADYPVEAGSGSLVGELKQLNELKQQGVLTQAEFDAAKAKLLGNAGSATGNTKAHPTSSADSRKQVSTPTNAKPNKDVISFSVDGQSYCAVKAPANNEFLGLYTYPGKEPCFGPNGILNNGPGEPIVQLDTIEGKDNNGLMGRTGKFQPHCAPALQVWWWLESDCKGNPKIERWPDRERYVLVLEFKTADLAHPVGTFSRMALDKWTDGSGRILILGEREKQK